MERRQRHPRLVHRTTYHLTNGGAVVGVLKMPSISKEYVKVPITTGPAGFTDLDVNMAIKPDGEDPAGGDWKTAEWIGTSAALLIGPGSPFGSLTKGGTFGIWVQIISNPEAPVLGPYPLHIT